MQKAERFPEQNTRDQDRLSETAEIIDAVIIPEQVYTYLKELQPPAPTTTVIHTRTPAIYELLLDAGVDPAKFDSRFQGTRSPAFLLKKPQRLWYSAHADEPTYRVNKPTNTTSFNLQPIGAHRPKVHGLEFPAAVLRYNGSNDNRYELISEGVIGTCDNMKPYYTASTKPKDGFLPGYDSIVYTPKLAFDEEGLLVGNMDNAAGIAASISAIKALKQIAERRGINLADFGVGWIFPDEEEGLPEDPAYFARGARRIIHRISSDELPEYIVNIDGHDADKLPPALAYASSVSGGKGPVVPPDIYAHFDRFLQGLEQYGVNISRTEEVGTVSRSDDAGWMEVHDQIMPVGYYVRDPHHNKGLPTANLGSIINIAKAMAWIAAELK